MTYDIAIIGGGPAGMMAAIRSAELGKKVIIIEKNPGFGVKLLITGKGRCNITNNTPDSREFIAKLGKKGNFLYSSLHQFGVADTIEFFESNGVKTKTERGDRVFPESDRSQDILRCLAAKLIDLKVEKKVNSPVKTITLSGNKIEKLVLANSEEIRTKRFIIASGGKSYPQTGSTGDAYDWLEKMGHKINPPSPALTPIIVKETFISQLEGLSLRNVKICIKDETKTLASEFGEALFTNKGMSGPIILNLSNFVNLEKKQILSIDFKPALSSDELDKRIQKDFQKNNNKQFKNSLDALLPQKIIPLFVKLTKINPEKQVNLVTREERKKLLALLKNFKMEIKGIAGYEKAITTSGGLELKEINPKTMQSKHIENLYLAGEILDLDGPTGGFNLQICWSTGFVAGDSAARAN